MTSAATATTVAGDVAPYGNPDDELNAGDLTVIQQFLLGIKSPTSQEINQCDVAPSGSPDGLLDVADYLLLQRAVLGLITLPPVGVAPNAPVLFAGESPTNDSAYLISGAADPDSTINVYVNGTPQRSKLADSNGDFLSYAKLQAGSNTIYVTASYGTLEGDPSNILNVDFVSLPPTADPGGPYTGPVYEYAYFDGRGSADKYNRSLAYQWDFGDGGTATGATPSHRYVSTGTYTVTLTVTAGGQVSAPVTTSVTIKGKEYLTYSANRTLSNDRIYIVDHNYTVPQLDTLTIEAGTELRFDYDGGLEINGTLDVRGTAVEPVRFSPLKGLADGYYPWLGIWLADYSRDVVIDHAIIEGALNGISVSYNGSEATIRNSVIQDNRWTGIEIYSSKADNNPTSPRVSGNLIQSTAIYPYGQSVGIFIKGDAKPLIIDGNIIRFNETGIGLGSGTALEGNSQPVITGNAIYRNVWNYSAYRPYPLQPIILNAQDNWWGTTDTVLINRDITDKRDDSQYVSVDYSNFRTLPLDHDLVLDPVYAETADNPLLVRGTAQPGAEVNLYARGSETFLLGRAVADVNGRFVHPAVFPDEGGYDLIARRVVNGVEVESSIPTPGFYYTPAPWWSDVPIINQVPIPITSNPYEITIDRDRDFREANIYVNGELQGMAMASYSSLYFLATLNAGANTLEAAFLTPTGEGPRSSPMTVYYVPDTTVTDFAGGTIGQYQHVVLPPAASPYQIDSDIVIESLGKLTLQAGAVMEFQPGIGIYASGELSVQGTAANPVHLQSAATTPLASDWIGILIPPNADMNTRIEHALIEHSALGIIFNSSFATVDHTTLQDNYYGIYADAGSNPVISNSVFQNNTIGLWVNGNASPVIYPHNTVTGNEQGIALVGTALPGGNPAPVIHENNLYGNTDFDLGLSDFYGALNPDFDARGNWWGSTVPGTIDSQIYDGKYPAANAPLVTYLPVQPALLTSSSPLTPDLDVGNGHTNQQTYTVTGHAEANRDIRVYLNGNLDGAVVSDADGNFSHPVTLLTGANEVYGVAVNGAETSLPYKIDTLVYDLDPPVITLTTPQEGGLVNYATFIGQLDEPGTLTIDGNPMSVKADNSFNAILSALPQGQNTVQLIATDLAGNSTLLDRSFMLDSVPPASPDTTLIGVGTPAGGTVTVSAQAGSATEGDTVTLTNSRTGESVQTTVAVDGSYSAAIGAQDGDVIVILITDPAGNTAASRILQVAGTPPVLGLTVTAPLNGSTIADDRVGVGGTFQGAANIGITVNGVTAQTIGNTFCAGDIALNTGPNTLDITAKLPDGTTTTQTLSVNSSGTSLITLEADAERGFEPHTVTFGITDNTQATLTSIEYDFDSDGTIDATLADPAATVQHVYTAPGCYTAMVTATDALSGSYSSSQTISVTDVQGADGQLASIFYNMLSRIRAGDISGAMTAVDPDRVDHFTTFFNNFGPDLPVFVDNIGRLEGGAFGEDIARFVLIRDVHGKPVSFFLYFTKGDDGVWRIEEM